MAIKHNNIIVDTDSRFLIDPTSRDIKQDGNAKIAIIQHDHNSERFSFSIPRFVDGHDMGASDKVEVHYVNISTKTKDESRGCYVVNDIESTDTTVELSWLIARTATKYAGTINFLVRFICYKEGTTEVVYTWNSSYYSGIPVGTGCDCSEELPEDYYDILESWKKEIESEFSKSIGNLENLTTENKTSLVEAINEINSDCDGRQTELEQLTTMVYNLHDIVMGIPKNIIPATLEPNTEYNFGTVDELVLVFPSIANDGDVIYVTFRSDGVQATNLIVSEINMHDEFDLIPEYGEGYELYAKYIDGGWLVKYSSYVPYAFNRVPEIEEE